MVPTIFSDIMWCILIHTMATSHLTHKCVRVMQSTPYYVYQNITTHTSTCTHSTWATSGRPMPVEAGPMFSCRIMRRRTVTRNPLSYTTHSFMSINDRHNASWHHIGWVQITIAKCVTKPVARVGYQRAGSRNDKRQPQHCKRQQFSVWHHITHFYPFICPNLWNVNVQHSLTHLCNSLVMDYNVTKKSSL